ncbi:hypothetical protein ACMGE9_04075 [Macrococcus sp. EM39E]|uniref:hypothetical protein n=1 Tax=Macrococcus animalis TaxID=3395467 RepID=UPI0039BE0902
MSKKLILSSVVLASTLLTAALPMTQVDAATAPVVNKTTLTNKTIPLPKMTKQTFDLLKKGKYAHEGVIIGQKYSDIKKNHGKFRTTETNISEYGKQVKTTYGKGNRLILDFFNRSKSYPTGSLYLTNMKFSADGKHILKSDIEKLTGGSTAGWGSLKDSKFIQRHYGGYLTISYAKENNKWLVYEISEHGYPLFDTGYYLYEPENK